MLTRTPQEGIRSLFLVDIENLCGSGRLSERTVTSAAAALFASHARGPLDHVVVACDQANLAAVEFGLVGHSHVVKCGHGADGADRKLLEFAVSLYAAGFDRLVLASGDHIFAPAVAQRAAAGQMTTVVTRRLALSKRLRMAAAAVVYLAPSQTQRAAVAPAGASA